MRFVRVTTLFLVLMIMGGCGNTQEAAPVAPISAPTPTTAVAATPESVIEQAFTLLTNGDAVSLQALCSTQSDHSQAEILHDMQQAWQQMSDPDPAFSRDTRVGAIVSRQIQPAQITGQTAVVVVNTTNTHGSAIWKGTLRQTNGSWTIDRLTTDSTTRKP